MLSPGTPIRRGTLDGRLTSWTGAYPPSTTVPRFPRPSGLAGAPSDAPGGDPCPSVGTPFLLRRPSRGAYRSWPDDPKRPPVDRAPIKNPLPYRRPSRGVYRSWSADPKRPPVARSDGAYPPCQIVIERSLSNTDLSKPQFPCFQGVSKTVPTSGRSVTCHSM